VLGHRSEKREVRIARGIVLGHGLVEKDTKTHSVRTVALDDAAVVAVSIHRAAALARLADVGLGVGSDLVRVHVHAGRFNVMVSLFGEPSLSPLVRGGGHQWRTPSRSSSLCGDAPP
jgi:hypothetical protein